MTKKRAPPALSVVELIEQYEEFSKKEHQDELSKMWSDIQFLIAQLPSRPPRNCADFHVVGHMLLQLKSRHETVSTQVKDISSKIAQIDKELNGVLVQMSRDIESLGKWAILRVELEMEESLKDIQERYRKGFSAIEQQYREDELSDKSLLDAQKVLATRLP